METQSTAANFPTFARAWIAVGFAAVAIAAVMSNSQAFAGDTPQVASDIAAAPQPALAELSDRVDWTKLPISNITPAETVAAYDR